MIVTGGRGANAARAHTAVAIGRNLAHLAWDTVGAGAAAIDVRFGFVGHVVGAVLGDAGIAITQHALAIEVDVAAHAVFTHLAGAAATVDVAFAAIGGRVVAGRGLAFQLRAYLALAVGPAQAAFPGRAFLLGAVAAALAAWALEAQSFALFCMATLLIGGNAAFVQQYRFAATEKRFADVI